MARTRDPAREKARELWLKAGGDKAPKGILKEISEELGKSESTIRAWKNRDSWGNATKKSATLQKKKKTKVQRCKKEEGKKVDHKEAVPEEVIEELLSSKLTEKQKLFCIYYIQSFNATQSAKRAGYSKKTAMTQGYQLLQKPLVKEEIEKLKQIQAAELMLEGNRILNRHAQIAFSDIAQFFEETSRGGLKLRDLDEIDGTLIKKITVKKESSSTNFGDTEKETLQVEVEDRKNSLNFLTKYLGMDPDNDPEGGEKEDNTLEVVRKCHN